MAQTPSSDRSPVRPEPAPRSALPGDGLDPARMPAHWLLARLGKRVLRPGGVELTRWMLDGLAVGPDDRVVELAAGLGATARLTLTRHPASYLGVDRDSAAVAALSTLEATRTEVRGHRADATATGLPGGSATAVYGEAMLTMQPEPAKQQVVREAHRLLGHSGRYGIHELCLVPDDIDPALAEQITTEISDAFHVGAHPLTVPGWRDLLTGEGFTVAAEAIVPMRLLEPARLVADEGLASATRIVTRALRHPAARRRVLRMRQVFRRHRRHLTAVGLVATRSGVV